MPLHNLTIISLQKTPPSWITLEQGKTTADAMGDVWRGLEVVEAATRVGSEMLVRIISIITQVAIQRSCGSPTPIVLVYCLSVFFTVLNYLSS
jgi:hypothetical protein